MLIALLALLSTSTGLAADNCTCFCAPMTVDDAGKVVKGSRRVCSTHEYPTEGHCSTHCGTHLDADGYTYGTCPVSIHEHDNYAGRSLSICADNADLRGDGINDTVSSMRIAPGCTLTLFEHINFTGRSFSFTEDVPVIRAVREEMSDQASSLKLQCP